MHFAAHAHNYYLRLSPILPAAIVFFSRFFFVSDREQPIREKKRARDKEKRKESARDRSIDSRASIDSWLPHWSERLKDFFFYSLRMLNMNRVETLHPRDMLLKSSMAADR